MRASEPSSGCRTRPSPALLGAPAIIVSEGGVGRPIDEIVLNAALFERHGVHVAGAIVNKVDVDANPDLDRTLERGLALHGVRAARRAAVPARSSRTRPWRWCFEGVGGELVHPGPTSIASSATSPSGR